MRISRAVTALIATGTATAIVCLTAGPALADVNRDSEWWLPKDGIETAWVTTQGAGVTIAVLSDGVDASHRDLVGSVTAAPAPAGAPVATGQFLGEQGTAIASLAAGHGHGARGLAGILGAAPAAKILSVPVTLPPGDPQLGQQSVAAAIPDAIAAGIRYAVQHHASVIDLPLDPSQPGSSGTGGGTAGAGGSSAEASAVSYALSHNVVLVAPAGDNWTSSKAKEYPAAYPRVISVGAFNNALDKAPWSSHEAYVMLTGPGAGVRAASNTGGYQTISSTAAASAVVAGVAALIRSRYPGLSVTQVTQALTSSTLFHRNKPTADGSGYGVLDADQALAAAAVMAVPASAKAGAGAQPLMPPAAQAAAATRSLGSELVRDGLMAVGLLVVLLVLVGVYAVVTRRRQPTRQPQLTAEWARRQAPSRYPQATASDADAMLEYFKTPVAEPTQRDGQAAGAGLPSAPGLFASPPGTRALRAGDRGVGSAEPAGIGDSSRQQLAAAGEPAASRNPVSRALSRRPSVSGAPPWDPARPPDTELPWNSAPQPAVSAESEPGWPVPARPGAAAAAQGPASSAGQPLAVPGGRVIRPDWRAGHGGPDRPAASGWAPEQGSDADAAIPATPQAWQEDGTGGAPAPFRRPSRAAELTGPAQDAGGIQPARPSLADNGWRSAASGPAENGWRSGSGSASGPAARQPDHDPGSGAGRHSWNSPAGSAPWNPLSASMPAQRQAPAPLGADVPDEQPRTSKAGLPIRTPRHTAPTAPSPSGSLWEPADRPAAQGDGDGQEPGRPMYVWRPAHEDEDYSGPA